MSIETILQNELIMEKIFDKIPIDKLFTKRFINQKFYQLILLYLKRRGKIIDFLQITTATNNDDNEEDDNSQDANEDDVHKEIFPSINPSLQTRYKLTLNFSYQYWLDDETLMEKIFNFNLIIMKNNNNNNKHEQQQQQINRSSTGIICCCCLKSMTTTTTILENIYLDHCWNITNTRLLKIFTNCNRIRKLSLSFIYSIDDKLLIMIGKLLKQLQWINLQCCYRITDYGIAGYVCLFDIFHISILLFS